MSSSHAGVLPVRARPCQARRAGYIGLVIIIGWVISGVIGIGIALATAYLAI